MTIGSLFDGIGGFPLAASRCGITPVWASEIDPFPMAVTRERLPQMMPLGDITQFDGARIPAVDIVTGGSPCQDLSVAGKRAGLAGERSGLFMEQIRVIREMRDHDKRAGRTGKHVRPRIMVWENVPGAFSSAKGEDFRAVLEETARIADDTVCIPRPAGGKWPTAGIVVGDGYSIAWRVMDAQYWGVPQRRRRIFLVADFGGGRAGEILFKPEGVRRNPAQSREAREKAPAGAGIGAESTNADNCLTPWDVQSRRIYMDDGTWPALYAGEGGGHGYVMAISINDKATRYQSGGPTRNNDGAGNGLGVGNYGDPAPTISCGDRHAVMVMSTGQANAEILEDLCPTLNCNHEQPIIAGLDVRNLRENGDICGTLQSKSSGGYSLNYIHPVRIGLSVRRLTPVECERLQGFPDGWTDLGDRRSSDTARYKALGNSVAAPCVEYIMRRIASVLGQEEKTC